MKNQFLKGVVAMAIIVTLFSFDHNSKWFKAGNASSKYEMGEDISSPDASTIKSITKDLDETSFGTYMTTIKPDQYFGKRIQLKGQLKSSGVNAWAGFWLRVDAKDTDQPLAFDNMQNRSIQGSTDWSTYEIVVDVPSTASAIAYGSLLAGSGQIWFKDIQIKVVDKSIPTTSMY